MFKPTNNYHQGNLFTDSLILANSMTISTLNEKKAWFNVFYREITAKIDEEKFRPLFVEGNMGAPNASIRTIIAINILKDGVGISDQQLFEAINCDLRYRRAVGLMTLEEKTPSQDVYYLLRRRIYKYEVETSVNLMQECFKDNVKDLLCTLNISGKSIRMDSKLIGSNIAWSSRYELVQQMFKVHVTPLLSSLNPSLRKQAEEIINRDSEKDQYRLDKSSIESLFVQMGIVLQKILVKIKASEDHILRRLFNEQYTTEQGKAQPRGNKEIAPDSIQSPFDTDATYRKKGDQKVKGYSTNITETVPEEGEMSVITDVQVKPANAADNDFLQDAVTSTENISGNKVENLYADGAYQSESNREFTKTNNIKFYTCGLQGKEGRYDYRLNNEGNIIVTEKKTGETFIAHRCRATKKSTKRSWVFINTDGKRCYITEKALETCELRKEIENIPPEQMNKRNNAEAGMFQYSFHTRNGKTRYRTLFKHKLHAYARCMWMNHRRYMSHINKLQCQGTLEGTIAI